MSKHEYTSPQENLALAGIGIVLMLAFAGFVWAIK